MPIQADLVASGLAAPTFAASAPGVADQLFITEKDSGRVVVLDLTTNQVSAQAFFDVPAAEMSFAGEGGLLGLAFHPDYATNGKVYSPRLPPGETYCQRLLREIAGKADLSKVCFTGRIPYAQYLALLRRSSVHVYLTYPFVLSWSLLEAMSAGCLVVASRTPPVEEVIRDGENGLLVDFFSTEQIAARIDDALAMQNSTLLRERARGSVIERYDLKRVCLPAQLGLVARLQDKAADAGAAAHVKHLPGDEAVVPVGEEQNRPRNVVGVA